MGLINKKKIASILTFIAVTIIFLPIIVSAADNPLVPCDGVTVKCDFDMFIKLINNIINWIIGIATSIFTISAIYGGFLYMNSGENPGNKTKAKDILLNTLYGFIIILVSWLIVYTLLTYIAPGNSSLLKFIKN
jgi:hypothetical protein